MPGFACTRIHGGNSCMKVLLTGATGNIGSSTLLELLKQGHQVRCLFTPRKANRRKARQLAGRAEIIWGDVRNQEDVRAAVEDQEVIIHLAFVIPPRCLEEPELARAVNVEGTRNLIEATKKLAKLPKFL